MPTLARDLQGSVATPVVAGRRPTFIANGAFRKKRPAPESAEDPVLQTQNAAEWGATETSPPLKSVTGGKNLLNGPEGVFVEGPAHPDAAEAVVKSEFGSHDQQSANRELMSKLDRWHGTVFQLRHRLPDQAVAV